MNKIRDFHTMILALILVNLGFYALSFTKKVFNVFLEYRPENEMGVFANAVMFPIPLGIGLIVIGVLTISSIMGDYL